MDELKETLSTMLTEEAGAVSAGAGDPPPEVKEEPAKPSKELSVADVLRQEAKAQKEAEKADSQAKEKAEEPVDVKQEKADSVKDENAEEPDGDEPAEGKEVDADKKADDKAAAQDPKGAQSEGKSDKVPARLLPREREVWMNTPNPIKAAWDRMEREATETIAKSQESVQFHESLRKFDDMAKAAGIPISEAMERYVSMDQKLAQNFGQGLAEIAQSFGKNPVEAVAQFMRSAGVLPQQLGAYLQGQPAQPQQPQAQQPQQRQQDPQVAHLQQELAQVKQFVQQQLETQSKAEVEAARRDIIEPLMAKHPRFEELRHDIAFFYNSDRIPTSMTPVERLEAAYDMAERINPAPVVAQGNLAEPAGKPASDAGKKSVRGAPATGISTEADFDNVTDLRDLLRKEARKLG